MAKRHQLGQTVDTNECILWEGAKNGTGYPVIWHDGKARMYLRVWWEQTNGMKIPKGRCICHKCDNPSCVNPAHLFLGSYAENLRDMRLKGRARHAVGVDHGKAIFKPDQIRAIREKYANGLRIRDLHVEYNCSRTAIHKIVHNKTWRHIT